MTCGEFEEIVHGLVRLELLDVALNEEALEHAWSCGYCAARMAEVQSVAEASEAAAEAFHGQEAPARVAMMLLGRFREQHQRRRYWRRTLEWAALGATAAGLLIAAWASYGRWKASLYSAPETPVASRSAASAGTEVGSWLPGDIQSAEESARGVLGSSKSDLGADFVPVPFGEGIEPGDAGMVVRVDLPRAALGALGYPVDEANAEDWLRADVLIGEDGWPRAVRLVH